MRSALFALIATGCAGTGAKPAGPPPPAAPPATDTEATARPQPAPEGTAPVVPEKGIRAEPHGPEPLPVVLASNPTPNHPATVTAAAPPEKVGAAVMKRGKIEVTGEGLDAATVTRTLNSATASLLLCYQNAATTNPAIAGTTTLTFKIDSAGKVSNADTSGGVDREVEQCLTGVATGLTFPKKTGAKASVSYPLTFSMK